MDMDTQHVAGYGAWTWTCIMVKYMLHPCCMSMSMQHVAMTMLHVHVHAACSCPSCMSQYMLRGKPFVKQISFRSDVNKFNPPYCTVYCTLYVFRHGTTSETSPARLFWESSRGISAKPNTNVSGFWCYILDIRSLVKSANFFDISMYSAEST
jgi:hypothetical protein